jgi:hypothetical protein
VILNQIVENELLEIVFLYIYIYIYIYIYKKKMRFENVKNLYFQIASNVVHF